MTPVAPMTLSDIFDRWFKLIGATWLRSLILSAILLGPAAIIFAIAIDNGFDEILRMTGQTVDEFDPEKMYSLVGFLVWFTMGMLIFLAGTVAATVSITITGCSEMSDRPISWQDALRTTFSLRLARVFGMYILEFLGFGLLIAVPYALLIAGIAVESLLLGLAGGILIFPALAGVTYLVVGIAFSVPAIAWEETAIIEGFRRSWALVRGNWWRTLGILIVMSLVVSFAISIIMTPLYIVALWGFFQSYFEMLGSLGNGEPDPAIARDMLASFGFAFGVVNAVSSIAQVMVAPLYMVVMYFDLRARRGEFSQPATSAPAPIS